LNNPPTSCCVPTDLARSTFYLRILVGLWK
jgi:hypothetical protein